MKKKTKIELPYPIALVVWEDSHTTSEDSIDLDYFESQKKREFYYAHVGWVLKDDDLGMTLVFTIRHDDEAETDISIPQSAIRYVEYLR